MVSQKRKPTPKPTLKEQSRKLKELAAKRNKSPAEVAELKKARAAAISKQKADQARKSQAKTLKEAAKAKADAAREASKPKPQPKPTVKEASKKLKDAGLGKKPLGSPEATRRKQAQTLRARTLSGGKKAPTVAQKSGRKVLSTLLKGASKVAGVAGMAVTAYDMYAAKQKVDTSVKQYEAKAREIAEASAAIKAPPKRGTSVMIAGQKVKIPAKTLKELKTVNVKSRAMDNPAKAKEAAPTAQKAAPTTKKAAPKDELTFSQAFNKARRERIKSGADYGKATFKWTSPKTGITKTFHTRTKEEQAKYKAESAKKPMKVGKPGYNRRKVK